MNARRAVAWLALASWASGAWAQSVATWDGESSGDWGTAANWVGNTLPPWGQGLVIRFYQPGAGNLNTFLGGAARTIGNLEFTDDADANVIIGTYDSLSPTAARNLFFMDPSGVSTLRVASGAAGRFTIGRDPDATGNQYGAIRITHELRVEHWGSGNLEFNRLIQSNDAVVVPVVTLTKTGTGTLVISPPSANMQLGRVNLWDGELRIGHDMALGAATSQVYLYSGTLSTTGNVNRAAANNFFIAGNVTLGNPTTTDNSHAGRLTLSGPVQFLGNYSITVPSAVTSEISGVITDNGYGFNKTGPGLLRLGGDNASTLTGSIVLEQGRMLITHANALGSSDQPTTVRAGAQLRLHSSWVINEPLILSGNGLGAIGANNGAFVFQNNGGWFELRGDITLTNNGATLTMYQASLATGHIYGVINGEGPLVLQGSSAPAGNNGGQLFRLYTNFTYSGDTYFRCLHSTTMLVRLEVSEVFPSATRLFMDTVNDNSTGPRIRKLILAGVTQTLAAVTSAVASAMNTNSIVGGGDTRSVLILDSAQTSHFYGRLGGEDSGNPYENNLEVWIRGGHTLVLRGTNTYEGRTVLEDGSTLDVATVLNLGTAPANYVAGHLSLSGGSTLRAAAGATVQLEPTRGVTLGTGGGVFHALSGGLLQVDSPVVGVGGLTVKGPGTVVLGADNTYGGVTVVESGSFLVVGAGETSGTLGAGNVYLDGTLIFGRGEGADEYVLGQSISGSGQLVQAGRGTVRLEGLNSYSGGTVVMTGTLVAAESGALGGLVGGLVVVSNGATLALEGNVTIPNALRLSGEGASYLGVITNSGALRNLGGFNTVAGNITVDTGTTQARIQSDDGFLELSGNVTMEGTGNLVLQGNGDGEISGIISGSGHLFKSAANSDAPGTWILSGANTFTGRTTIAAGTLAIWDESNLGVAPSVYLNNHLRIRGGVLRVMSDTAISPTRGVMLSNGGGGIEVDWGSTLTVQSPVVGGAADVFEKHGGGTLVLAADSSFAGPVFVYEGTLQVSANLSGGGSVTVVAGTLSGTGTIAGGLIVEDGSILAPGASPGTLTVGGNVTLDEGSTFEVELNGLAQGTEYDALLMGSGTTLTLSNPTLNVLLGFAPNIGDSFQIVSGFSSRSGTFDGLPDGSTFQVDSTLFRIDYNPNDITLTVVPEPGTLGTLLLGAAVVCLRRRLQR